MLRKDHPFNPGEHKYSMILPIGGMILLGITCLTLGFVLWPEPKPHYDRTTEGTFPPAPAQVDPAAGDREPEQPRERFQKKLDALLAAPEPRNPEWQQKLLFSYNLLGSVEMGSNPEAARARFGEGLEAAKKLVAADPGNHAWQHEAVSFCGRLGGVELAAGNHDAAAARHGECLELAKNMAAANPDDVELQLDIVGIELQLVVAYLAAQKRAEARSHVAAARAVFTRLERAGLLREDGLVEPQHMMMVESYRKSIPAFENKLAEPGGD
jgi:hypothetical protein